MKWARIHRPEMLAMHALYLEGASLAAVGRQFKRNKKVVRKCFVRNGLSVRPYKVMPRGKDGRLLAAPALSKGTLERLIAEAPRVEVPKELCREWRLWSLERRMWLIGRLRERFPSTRPKGKFSKNVVPFDYGTPAARDLVKQLNRGRNSRNKKACLKPASEGVIFEGQLWFWCKGMPLWGKPDEKPNFGDGYFLGRWTKETGRPCLHRVLWERAHGKVPAGETVIFKDGNKNNFESKNLVLRSKAECARQNITRWRLRRSRELASVLLKVHQERKRKNGYISTIERLKDSTYRRGV
jgi:hypothetical protein